MSTRASRRACSSSTRMWIGEMVGVGSRWRSRAARAWDHSTPYLRRVLADMWQADLSVVERELTLAATTPAMEPLRGLAAELHGQALDAAHDVGRAFATK